jgi:hypothetical protein
VRGESDREDQARNDEQDDKDEQDVCAYDGEEHVGRMRRAAAPRKVRDRTVTQASRRVDARPPPAEQCSSTHGGIALRVRTRDLDRHGFPQ